MDVVRGRVRAALIGEQPMFLQPLAHWLSSERGIETSFIGGYDSCPVAQCVALAPDVAVVDQQSGNGSLASMVAALRAAMPKTTILLLAEKATPETKEAAAASGCDGLVAKDGSAESLAVALLAARHGAASAQIAHTTNHAAAPGQSLRLTVREREVLYLLAGGTSTAAIGQRLHIARNTARAHVQRVIEKLGAHSKLEAVAVARRTGIITS
ncbi:MAG: response regulator transcription factor [Planctomycetes bacterium]|nr:response regulator transcription factor [Planctomycetota bacterium]